MQGYVKYLAFLLLFLMLVLFIFLIFRIYKKVKLGILAYESLIDEPGEEIQEKFVNCRKVLTPFNVEFARKSRSRDDAPTLVPVISGGVKVKATILVLDENLPEKSAIDMLWRREKHIEGSGREYSPPAKPGSNTVLIEKLYDLKKMNTVLYAKIAPNIDPLTPQELAQLAINSARSEAGMKRQDGISYLIAAKRNGIRTPLMPKYEEEILRRTNSLRVVGWIEILCYSCMHTSPCWKLVQS